jgi:hypothetical protein
MEQQSPPGDRPYNNPDLTPLEFLTEVYRAHNLPMVTRIRAADEACKILLRMDPHVFDPPPPISCTVRIGNIFHKPDGTPIPDTLELYRDLLYVKRCWDLGILPVHLDDVAAEGSA